MGSLRTDIEDSSWAPAAVAAHAATANRQWQPTCRRPSGGGDRPGHHAVLQPLVALVGEAGVLVHPPGAVVEEGARHLLALRLLRQVVRVALDAPAACLGDEVQGA